MADKIRKTEFDEVLSHGVDFKNRRIYFGVHGGEGDSEFSWNSVETVIRALHIMESNYKHAPIELHMSSDGGDVSEMMRLYDAIHASSCQIKFFGSGSIMSAASLIMASCDERYLTPNTQVMVHKWHTEIAAETETDIKIELRHYTDWLSTRMNQILADNSRMPLEFWEEVTKRDLYLNAEEAVLLGLADFIIQPKKRGNLRRKRIAKMSQPADRAVMKKLINDINRRTERGKNLKIELHVPEEEFDKDVIVEELPTDVVLVDEPLEKVTPATQDKSSD